MKLKKFLKSKLIWGIVIVCIMIVGFIGYSKTVINNYDNSNPRDAIAKYIYDDNPTFKVMFMDVEKLDVTELELDNTYEYYIIKDGSWFGKPNNRGGTFFLKHENNNYYVVDYDNIPYKQNN